MALLIIAGGFVRFEFRKSTWRLVRAGGVCLLLMTLVAGCDELGARDIDYESDDDVDGGDADTDADGDSDSDGDTDTAENEQLPCPMGSGWPCACTNPGGDCDDGNPCHVIADLGNENVGICFKYCDPGDPDPDLTCPESGFPATADCVGVLMVAATEHTCALVCEDLYDCPVFQGCQSTGSSFKMCHP